VGLDYVGRDAAVRLDALALQPRIFQLEKLKSTLGDWERVMLRVTLSAWDNAEARLWLCGNLVPAAAAPRDPRGPRRGKISRYTLSRRSSDLENAEVCDEQGRKPSRDNSRRNLSKRN
jgi:hypothetical protein